MAQAAVRCCLACCCAAVAEGGQQKDGLLVGGCVSWCGELHDDLCGWGAVGCGGVGRLAGAAAQVTLKWWILQGRTCFELVW